MPSLPPIEKDVEKRARARDPSGAFDDPDAIDAALDPLEDAYYDYLVRLGDDSLILGQRLSEWCGHAPAVEVDLSLANLALDLIGQATILLGHANNDDADELAFTRDVLDFKNCLLVEQPNGDFAQTIVRQLLYSTWQHIQLRDLTESPDPFLRSYAAKAVKEVAYHRELASDWTIRLGDGTEESARRLADGLDWCWRFVPELFDVDDSLEEMIARQTVPDPRSFETEYYDSIEAVLKEARMKLPADQRPILGGRHGHHSEHLGHLLAVMQFLPRTYPRAQW